MFDYLQKYLHAMPKCVCARNVQNPYYRSQRKYSHCPVHQSYLASFVSRYHLYDYYRDNANAILRDYMYKLPNTYVFLCRKDYIDILITIIKHTEYEIRQHFNKIFDIDDDYAHSEWKARLRSRTCSKADSITNMFKMLVAEHFKSNMYRYRANMREVAYRYDIIPHRSYTKFADRTDDTLNEHCGIVFGRLDDWRLTLSYDDYTNFIINAKLDRNWTDRYTIFDLLCKGYYYYPYDTRYINDDYHLIQYTDGDEDEFYDIDDKDLINIHTVYYVRRCRYYVDF